MNANVKNLPYLIRLLDDDTPVVRDAVIAELLAHGPDLDDRLEALEPSPTAADRARLAALLEPRRMDTLRQSWPAWIREPTENARLEHAFQLLTDFMNPRSRPVLVPPLLDSLARRVRESLPDPDPVSLAAFLFRTEGFRGAHADYYHPENSDLAHVILHRHGIPITLTCLFILVGSRLGLEIEGCNYPGHFLARCKAADDKVFIDCFDHGRMLTEQELVSSGHSSLKAVRNMLYAKTDARTILERVLRNLVQAYRKRNRHDLAELMIELLDMTRELAAPKRRR